MAIHVNPEEDFHVSINGTVLALSLDALDAAYQGDKIDESTLIWQQGLGEWMRLDLVLSQLGQEDEAPAPAPAASATPDTFQVMVAEGDLKQMSQQLLADALRMGVIDGQTLVWQPGYTEWVPVSAILGNAPDGHVSLAPSRGPQAPAAPPAPRAFGSLPARADSAPVPASTFAPRAAAPLSAAPAPFSQSPELGASTAPVMIPTIAPRPRASPWYGRAVVAAGACAALFSLHQNGIAAEVTQQAVQGTSLADPLKPSPHTPYGLQLWLSNISETYHLEQLTETASLEEMQAEKDAAIARKKEAEALLAKEKSEKAAAAEATPGKDNKAANGFSARLNNKKMPAQRRPAARPASRPSTKSALPSTGDAHDPMNGAL